MSQVSIYQHYDFLSDSSREWLFSASDSEVQCNLNPIVDILRHGTSFRNVGGILRDGLLIAPEEAKPVSAFPIYKNKSMDSVISLPIEFLTLVNQLIFFIIYYNICLNTQFRTEPAMAKAAISRTCPRRYGITLNYLINCSYIFSYDSGFFTRIYLLQASHYCWHASAGDEGILFLGDVALGNVQVPSFFIDGKLNLELLVIIANY